MDAPTFDHLDDPRMWLESVEGTKQLEFVKAKNDDALSILGHPEKQPMYDRILSILDSKEKIPYVGRVLKYARFASNQAHLVIHDEHPHA